MQNPALRQESRYEPATVIPLKQESSLLDWLSANNRLIPRETEDAGTYLSDDEEIAELMDVDDDTYIDDDDDFEDTDD